MLRIASWNINSVNSAIKTIGNANLVESVPSLSTCDIICLQETKRRDNLHVPDGFEALYNDGVSGKNGVAVLYRKSAISNVRSKNVALPAPETLKVGPKWKELYSSFFKGRLQMVEFGFSGETFMLINVYVPNTGTNFDTRLAWDFLMPQVVAKNKNVIYCGDLNIDIKRAKHENALRITKFRPEADFIPGLSVMETDGFLRLLEEGKLKDVKPRGKLFTYKDNKQAEPSMKIDYFLLNKDLFKNTERKLTIDQSVFYGPSGLGLSDHAVVVLWLRLL